MISDGSISGWFVSGWSQDVLLFVAVSFAGAIVAGVAGFAFGLVVSSLWLHVIAPAECTPLIAAYAIVIQSMSVWGLRKSIDLRRIAPFLVGGVVGIPIGVEALRWATPLQMRTAVGVILVGFSVYTLVRSKTTLIARGSSDNPSTESMVGLIGGILGGSTGLGGIAIIIWSAIRGWPKDKQRAIFQPVTISILTLSLIWMGSTGVLTANILRLFLFGLPAVLIGSWIGLKLYGRLDEASFRNLITVLLLVSGLNLISSVLPSLR